MIVIPQIPPKLLKSLEADFGSSVANAIWKRMIEHQNYINASMPVGLVMWFYGSQRYADGSPGTLITQPSSNWQFCNGGLITNTNSPLLGQNVPDLRQRFLRGGSTIGTLGGSNVLVLAHSHGGFTGSTDDREGSPPRTDDDVERNIGNPHVHPIDADLSNRPKLPPYTELQPFMRIV